MMRDDPDSGPGESYYAQSGPTPRKPERLNELASQVLDGLMGHPECSEIILGGYLAMQHYCDHRQTRDVDAWWRDRSSALAEAVVRDVMRRVAEAADNELRERRFGETCSFELCREGKKYFSFQIAVRSVQLESPLMSPWPPIRIESLSDNIGSKMNALVERGAPRDFVDIYEIVTQSLSTIVRCWELWQRKNPEVPIERAQEKVLYHLTSLDVRRPLSSIADSEERARAARTRHWYRLEFLRGLG